MSHSYINNYEQLDKLRSLYHTPFYLYDYHVLDARLKQITDTLSQTNVYYAMKANSNLNIIKKIFNTGIGADVVSEGEIRRALLAGCDSHKIVFSGVGKSREEIAFAVKNNIGQINVESLFEIDFVLSVARQQNKPVNVGLRVNPNIAIDSNPKISTGLSHTKFGIPIEDISEAIRKLKSSSAINIKGLACHLGSQMYDLRPLELAANKLVQLSNELQIEHKLKFSTLDLGGGLAISYQGEPAPLLEDYAKIFVNASKNTDLQFMSELGRWVVGPTGYLVSSVLGCKSTSQKNFVVVDSGMTELMRPALYDGIHEAEAVQKIQSNHDLVYDVVGPVCETTDILLKDYKLPCPQKDDFIIFKNVGAYGYVMASNYNSRLKPAELSLADGKLVLIRRRESYGELWSHEVL